MSSKGGNIVPNLWLYGGLKTYEIENETEKNAGADSHNDYINGVVPLFFHRRNSGTNSGSSFVEPATPTEAIASTSESLETWAAYVNETIPATNPTENLKEEKKRVERYEQIVFTEEEYWSLAAIVWLEARNQPEAGQQAVVEVILNRMLHEGFPDAITEIIHEGEGTDNQQFTPSHLLDRAEPGQEQFDAIDRALYGPTVLPVDVVFFSREAENERVYRKIGDHVFCFEYLWEE